MLNQSELNFYGHNQNNIYYRRNRGHIKVIMYYDANNKYYVIKRTTLKTTIIERNTNYKYSLRLAYHFTYLTFKELNYNLKIYGRYLPQVKTLC